MTPEQEELRLLLRLALTMAKLNECQRLALEAIINGDAIAEVARANNIRRGSLWMAGQAAIRKTRLALATLGFPDERSIRRRFLMPSAFAHGDFLSEWSDQVAGR